MCNLYPRKKQKRDKLVQKKILETNNVQEFSKLKDKLQSYPRSLESTTQDKYINKTTKI